MKSEKSSDGLEKLEAIAIQMVEAIRGLKEAEPEPQEESLELPTFPKDLQQSLTAFYGPHGVKGQNYSELTTFRFPQGVKWVLGWEKDREVRSSSCHWKVKPYLEGMLQAWVDELGPVFMAEHALNEYWGCYNPRKRTANGDRWSTHAWGISVDFAADLNWYSLKWAEDKVGQDGFADMPVEAIEIAERFGAVNLGKKVGKDAMHFQWAQ